MIVLWCIVALILIISLLKIGISVEWKEELCLRLALGPVRIDLISGSSKSKTSGKPSKADRTSSQKKKRAFNTQILLDNWHDILALLGRLLRMPVLDPFVFQVTFGGNDPSDAALNYGRAWAAVGAVFPVLESNFKIGHRDIDIRYDENADTMKFYVKTFLYARVWQCVAFAVSALMLFLRIYREMNQTNKAV